jgi:hypothetical protein
MGHFFYRLRTALLRFPRFEQKTAATGSTWAAIAMSIAGFLCRCALLIIPKKENDYVDTYSSSLPAPSNNHAAMHTSWCRSGCGLFALVYHSSTPQTSQGTEVFVSSRCIVPLGHTLGASLVRTSKAGRPSVRVRTYLHHRGFDGFFSHV